MSRMLHVFDDERGALSIEFYKGMAFLHATFLKPVAAMRFARSIFQDLKTWLKSMGHDMVYAVIPEGDEKLYRFERRFGFVELDRKRGIVLMGQEC